MNHALYVILNVPVNLKWLWRNHASWLLANMHDVRLDMPTYAITNDTLHWKCMANSYHGEIYKHTACSTVYLIPSTCESEKRLLRDGVKTSDNTEPSELHIVKLKSMFFCITDYVNMLQQGWTISLLTLMVEYISLLAGTKHPLVSPLLHTLPSDTLQQLPPFNYAWLSLFPPHYNLWDSETVAENQCSVATDTYRAGAMQHKEQGQLFHVKVVRFHPGSSSDNHCIFQTEVKPSMKTTGSYSTVVALSKLTGYVIGACCKCKAGAGGCCTHVVALL